MERPKMGRGWDGMGRVAHASAAHVYRPPSTVYRLRPSWPSLQACPEESAMHRPRLRISRVAMVHLLPGYLHGTSTDTGRPARRAAEHPDSQSRPTGHRVCVSPPESHPRNCDALPEPVRLNDRGLISRRWVLPHACLRRRRAYSVMR
jgi:hypothetical protein